MDMGGEWLWGLRRISFPQTMATFLTARRGICNLLNHLTLQICSIYQANLALNSRGRHLVEVQVKGDI